MKKLTAFVLVFVCILALYSCGWNAKQVVAAVFSENVSKVDIIHRIGTETTNWSIEGTEIDPLREWFNKLSYRHIEVKEGQSPGDSNGNEVYTFTFTGGEWSGFSYVINGEKDCYILNPEGNWFSVTNPATPPVSDTISGSLQYEVPVDWSDFIKIDGVSYIGDWRKTEVSPDRIGTKIGEVSCGVPTIYTDGEGNILNLQPENGASFLCGIGTELFSVSDSDNAIAALVDGKYYLYTAD